MIRRLAIPALAGLMMVLGAAHAGAQGHDQVTREREVIRTPHMRGAWKNVDLNLSDDQKKKIESIYDKQRRDGIKMRADLEVAQLDLGKLMRADAPDRAAINSQIDRMSNLRSQLRKAQVGAMLDMRAVLTPEQQKKWRDARPMGPGMGGRRMSEAPDDADDMMGMLGVPTPDDVDSHH